MTARLRRVLVIVLWTITVCIGIAVLLGLAAVIILPSPWFRDKVRDRLVSEIERSTGGRADIGVFNFDWNSLTAEVTPLVVHGSEPANEAPLLRAEAAIASETPLIPPLTKPHNPRFPLTPPMQ